MINNWFAAPKFDDHQQNHTSRLLNGILLVSFAATVLALVLELLNVFRFHGSDDLRAFFLTFYSLVVMSISYVLLRQRYLQTACVFYLLSMWFMLTVFVVALGGIRTPLTITLFILIVPAGMLLSTRGILLFLGLNLMSFVIAFWVEVYDLQWITYEERAIAPFQFLGLYVPVTIVTAGMLFFTMRNIRLLLDRLAEEEKALIANNHELQAIQATLEEQVMARTEDLRTVAKLNSQLSQILDIDQLLLEIVNQVQHQFNYYHVHVYLLNEDDDAFVVVAATGEVGRQMVASKHSIAINAPASLVARAARTATVVAVNDVTEVDNWLPNQLLPNTQSELAIPLLKGGKAVGVLDIQDEEKGRFSSETVALMQSIADPISIAVDNARLYSLAQQEIAQRNSVEADLRRNEARYRVLFEDSPVAFWEEDFSAVKIYLDRLKQENVTDFRAYFAQNPEKIVECLKLVKVLDVNRACLDLHEVESKELLLAVFESKFSSQQLQVLTEGLIALAEGKQVLRQEFQLRTFADNEIYVSSSMFIPVEGNWSQVIVAMIDNSEHKEAENTLIKLNQELMKLNDDKDRFFSIVAHDLKGPFMPLLGNTELMAEMADILPPTELKTMSQSIHRTAEGMFKLLEDLLAWSRFQMGRMKYEPENLNLSDFVAETFTFLAFNATEKNITLNNHVDLTFSVLVDQHMFATIIRNLISNALKFTPKGGQITVSAESSSQAPNFIQISIADSGIGISHEDIDKLFRIEVQHTTEGTAKEKGTGLGLPLCREMVERHGGQIWVESELNVGSIFTFTVPVGEAISPENGTKVKALPHENLSSVSEPQPRSQVRDARVMTAADVIKMSETVNHSAKGIYDLLDDLRRWVRDELNTIAHNPSEIDLEMILSETVTLFREQAKQKGISLNYKMEENLSSVYADSDTLGIVIQGLIVNALKFTPNGGQITLSARLIQESIGAASLENPIPKQVDFVKIRVTDTGQSLSQRLASHQSKHRGIRDEVGLGLTLYQELVERNGGRIWVEQESEQGTILKFTIPTRFMTSDEQEQVNLSYQQLETRLLEREQLLQTVTDAMPQTIFWKDKNSVFLGCNQKLAQSAGLSNPVDIIGKTDYELPWSNLADTYREDDRRIMQKGQPELGILESMLQANGQTILLETNKIPLQNAAGEVIGILGTFEDVTERQRMREALNKQQQLLETFVNNAPVIIFTLDQDGVYTMVDGQGLRDVGGNQNDVIGQSVFDLYPDDHQTIGYVRRALAGERLTYIFELQDTYFDVRLAPIRNEAGAVIGVAGVSFDITSRHEAEQTLQQTIAAVEQSKKLLASVIDATPDWVFVRDRQFNFILVNNSFAQACGTEPQVLIGKSDREFKWMGFHGQLPFSEGALNLLRTEDETVLSGKMVHNRNDVIPFPDGSVRIYDKYKLPLRDEGGHVFGILTFSRDITKLRQTEQELEAHRSHLEDIIHDRTNRLEVLVNVSQMMNANLDFSQLMANTLHYLQENFGYYFVQVFVVEAETGDLVFAEGSGEAGKQLKQQGYRFHSGQGIVGTVAATKQVFMSNDVGQSREFVPNILLADTKSKLAAPMIRDNRVVGVLGIHSSQLDEFTEDDVSLIQSIANQLAVSIENSQLLTDRQATIKKLRQLDQAKSQFITMISHELRTPLQAINGFAELLVFGMSGDLSEQAQQETELILNNGKHLLQLIDSIIDITQIEAGEMQITLQTVDVFVLVSEALADSRSLLKDKPIEMVNTVSESLPAISADPTRLLQILFNLISNAIKFTHEGEITVGAEVYEADSNMVIFRVSDTGVGIEAEKQREIFQLFQQLDMTDGRQYGGIGVGLSTCKLLTDLHGGEIGVQSEQGVGSEFWFTMPIAAESKS